MNNKDNTQVADIATIEVSPLKKLGYKGKLTIKDNMAILEKSKSNRIAHIVIKLMVYAFWISVFYNLFNLNFILFDEAPLLASILLILVFYFAGLVVTFSNWVMNLNARRKEYIDQESKEVRLKDLDDDKKYSTDDIIGIQLIGYIKERHVMLPNSFSRTTVILTLYEINLVAKDHERINLMMLNNKEKALKNIEKLSEFLERPYTINIEETERENRSKQADKTVKNRCRSTACVIVKTAVIETSFENLKKNSEYEINKIADNQFLVSAPDEALAFLLVDKKIGKLK